MGSSSSPPHNFWRSLAPSHSQLSPSWQTPSPHEGMVGQSLGHSPQGKVEQGGSLYIHKGHSRSPSSHCSFPQVPVPQAPSYKKRASLSWSSKQRLLYVC